jgi:hypothetical protein
MVFDGLGAAIRCNITEAERKFADLAAVLHFYHPFSPGKRGIITNIQHNYGLFRENTQYVEKVRS